jgi:ankyrin repeat protein
VGGVKSDSQNGATALMYAAICGGAECVRLLIDAGANKNATNNVRRRSLLC